ncbi:MAG: Hpt domain-containing protein [Gemmatimonadota bacterium]|nr:MAG: Hpt domain-containing protein [Gemmatimonadota bacterium]
MDAKEAEQILKQIQREFREGLPARLERIRAALTVLAEGYDAEAVEVFYRTAHSLKGTAPSFDADELVDPASALAESGRRWCEEGALDSADLAAAFTEFERLADAVERYAASEKVRRRDEP